MIGNGFNKVDLDLMRKFYEESKQKQSIWWKPAKENIIRVLPPWRGSLAFKAVLRHEVNVRGKFSPYTCGRDPWHPNQGECYTCDYVLPQFRILEDENEEAAQMVETLKPRWRAAWNIIDKTSENTINRGVQVWICSKKRFENIMTFFADTKYADICDPEHGRDIVVTRTGTGIDTEYTIYPGPTVGPIGVTYAIELHDLDHICKPMSALNMATILWNGFGIPIPDELRAGKEVQAEAAPAEQTAPADSEEAPPENLPPWDVVAEDGGRTAIKVIGGLSPEQYADALAMAAAEVTCYLNYDMNNGICRQCELAPRCSHATAAARKAQQPVQPTRQIPVQPPVMPPPPTVRLSAPVISPPVNIPTGVAARTTIVRPPATMTTRPSAVITRPMRRTK